MRTPQAGTKNREKKIFREDDQSADYHHKQEKERIMQISNDFYLSGFTRQDKGEAGAVFLRREAPKERGKRSVSAKR